MNDPRWAPVAHFIWARLPGPLRRLVEAMGRSLATSVARRAVPSLLRSAVLAVLWGALAQQVLHAARFTHDQRFLDLLAGRALEGWLLVMGFVALWAVRWWLAPLTSADLVDKPLRYGLVVFLSLVGLASTFASAYAIHFTVPVLAAASAWTLAPGVERLAARWSALPRVAATRWSPLAGAALVFLIVFAQSYRRHLWFGSGGKDLGLFHQSVWLLSRFEAPHNTLLGTHAFADHLEFIDVLAAPLQWLWPSAGALLLFQALLVAAGVLPLFDLAARKLGSTSAAWALVGVYLFGIDMQNAVMFDWNPTTCGAALLPWVVWFFEKRRAVMFALAVALLALTKENLVLYALALCLTLARGGQRRLALGAAAVLAVWFVVEIKVVFPSFGGEFRHLRYPALGETGLEMLGSVLRSPHRAFALLFTPGAKINGLVAPFSSVAFACCLAPRYAIAFAPALLERFWSAHANRWWDHHYGAGIGVLAVLAAIEGLARLKAWTESRGRRDLVPAAVLAVLLAGLMMAALPRFGPGPLWVWRHAYYTSPEDRRDAEALVARVPPHTSVAAQNHLLPHLSARPALFELARPIRTEFVALDFAQDAWPFERAYPRKLASELLRDGYGAVFCAGQAVLLRRGARSVPCRALQREP